MKRLTTKRRKLGMYIAAFAFLLLSFLFLILAAYTNPSIVEFAAKINGTKPSPQIEYGSFATYVDFILNSTTVDCFVRVNFTLSGKDLSVGQPILLRVNASIQEPPSFQIVFMIIELENTFQSGTPYTPDIGLNPVNNSLRQSVWFGSGLFEFNTVGPLIATIHITGIDKAGKLSTTTLPKNIIPELIIGPTGSGQAKFYEDQNLSLTLFILFFAAIDIAVTIYDHSYEDVEKSQNSAQSQQNQTDGDCNCPH